MSWLVLRRAMFQLAIGVLTGAGCAIVWNRLFGVSAPDAESKEPLVLAAAAILIAGFGLAACLFPGLGARLPNRRLVGIRGSCDALARARQP